MSGLILELQSNALDKDTRVSDLLRKALVVSKKLGIDEIEKWINNELHGYSDATEIPLYRQIQGEVKVWNPFHGWQPLNFSNPEMAEVLSKRPLGQSVGELDALIENLGEHNSLKILFPQEAINALMTLMDPPLQPALHISYTEIIGILDTIRTNVLSWALELEQKGIIGDGMSFSKEEKSVANQVTYQITNNIGSMNNSQLQQHSAGASQSISKSIDLKSLKEFVTELNSASTNLPLHKSTHDELIAELRTLESQADSPKPKTSIISESLKSIKTILEGVVSNILASELLSKISILLQNMT